MWTTSRPTRALGVLWLLLVVWFAPVPEQRDLTSSPVHRPAQGWPVESAFRDAFQLWANGRFDGLWRRGMLASRYRVAREVFVHEMRHRVSKPTCCWGQIREVQVHLQGADEAVVEAQVGMTVRTLGTTLVPSIVVYLRREGGVW